MTLAWRSPLIADNCLHDELQSEPGSRIVTDMTKGFVVIRMILVADADCCALLFVVANVVADFEHSDSVDHKAS